MLLPLPMNWPDEMNVVYTWLLLFIQGKSLFDFGLDSNCPSSACIGINHPMMFLFKCVCRQIRNNDEILLLIILMMKCVWLLFSQPAAWILVGVDELPPSWEPVATPNFGKLHKLLGLLSLFLCRSSISYLIALDHCTSWHTDDIIF